MQPTAELQLTFSQTAEALPLACVLLSIDNGMVVAVNSRAIALIGKSLPGKILAECSEAPNSITQSIALFAGSRSPVPASWTLTVDQKTIDLKVSGARVPIGSTDLVLLTMSKKAVGNEGIFGELTMQLDSIRRERHNLLRDNKQLEARVEERTAQLQLQNTELDALNTSLQHFVSMVSHDIAGPVRRIQSFSHLLLKHLEKVKLEGNAVDFLHYLEESAIRLSQMLDGIVRLSRVTVDLERWATVDLDALLLSVTDDLKGLNPSVEIDVQSDPLGEVFGDPGQIQQLLLNLINNAIKFRLPGQPAQIRLSCETLPENLSLTRQRELVVSDAGIGINASDRERVLRPFVRGAGAEEQPGYGLGLAMCLRICQLHKGNLWIERSVHFEDGSPSGTEIRLRLPSKAD